MKKAKPTLTIADINWLLDSLERKFITKDDFKKYTNKVLEKLDLFVGEIKNSREQQELNSGTLSNHEDRIEKVEKHLQLPVTS